MHTKYVSPKHRHASSFQAVTSAAPAVSVTGADAGLCVTNHQPIAVKRPTEETATSPRGSVAPHLDAGQKNCMAAKLVETVTSPRGSVAPEKSCWSSEEEDGSLFAAPMPTRMKQLGCSSQVWAFANHSERHRLKRMLKTDERALRRRVRKLTEMMEKPRPDAPVHTDSELGGDGPCDANESRGDGNDGVASPEQVKLLRAPPHIVPRAPAALMKVW